MCQHSKENLPRALGTAEVQTGVLPAPQAQNRPHPTRRAGQDPCPAQPLFLQRSLVPPAHPSCIPPSTGRSHIPGQASQSCDHRAVQAEERVLTPSWFSQLSGGGDGDLGAPSWGVMLLWKVMNCAESLKPESQVSLKGQLQPQLTGANLPGLLAAGSMREQQ